MTWQRSTWRLHGLPFSLVTWPCGCGVCLLGGCRDLWAAGVARGGGGYLCATWWQGVLEVVEGGGCGMQKEAVSRCVTRVMFGSTFELMPTITLAPKFVVFITYTVL
jgi:hypothetical protein